MDFHTLLVYKLDGFPHLGGVVKFNCDITRLMRYSLKELSSTRCLLSGSSRDQKKKS